MNDLAATLPSLRAFQVARPAYSTSGRTLEALGMTEESAIVSWLSEHAGVKEIGLLELQQSSPDFTVMSLARAHTEGCVVTTVQGQDSPWVIATDPFNEDVLQWVEVRLGGIGEVRVTSVSDLNAFLSKHEASMKAMTDTVSDPSAGSLTASRSTEVLTFASVSEATSPVVRVLNATIYDALKLGASDIHLETFAEGLQVRYRVDGVMESAARVNGSMLAEQTISRLKVLSELDIAEHRVPQDGSFRVMLGEREIDLRVSIMPSVHGEDAVIRILDKQALIEKHGALTLDALGFDSHSLGLLRSLAAEPYGMLLVTGPTGSGKTTTLYGAIAEINSGTEKIITIEDPVEYQLTGVLQIPVNDKKGLSFARGLRSILRHDPDKIMVGEIRDRETAEIAVQSALTGHLVLTTVHANNVFDVFGRFTHMGLDPYAFSSALNGIWAQRLMRVICTRCAQPSQPTPAELKQAGISGESSSKFKFMQGVGCGACRNTGYRGRKAIAEVLLMNDHIRALITEKRPVGEIREAAVASGTQTLHNAALKLVAHGETTLEEMRRVTLSV